MTTETETGADRGEVVLRLVPHLTDINANGHIFGGWVLSQMDIAGGIVASRIAQGAVATVAIESMTFITPILLGDVVSVYAREERAGGRRWRSGSTWWRYAVSAWRRWC